MAKNFTYSFDSKTFSSTAKKNLPIPSHPYIWWEQTIPSVPVCHQLASSPEVETQTVKWIHLIICKFPRLPAHWLARARLLLIFNVSQLHCLMVWPIVMVGQETHLGCLSQNPLVLKPGLTPAFIFYNILTDAGSKTLFLLIIPACY